MQHFFLRLGVALLTFVLGVSCSISCRAKVSQGDLVLERESVLRDDLYKMRTLIDQYAADRGSQPKSLDDLVKAGYLRELPKDPFTGERDWVVAIGTDPNLPGNQQGVIDVHSASSADSRNGTPYKEW